MRCCPRTTRDGIGVPADAGAMLRLTQCACCSPTREVHMLDIDVIVHSPHPNSKLNSNGLVASHQADQVEGELNNELDVLANCQDQLTKAHAAANAELRALKDCEVTLDADLRNKANAEIIDVHTHTLATKSAELGMFADTVKHNPSGTVEPKAWFANSNKNVQSALKEVGAGQALGARIHVTLDNCASDQKTQAAVVDSAFQQRINEVDVARANDESQIAKTRDEMTAQRATIAALQNAIAAKNAPLQLATTRLATRAGRPGIERTADAAHHSLVTEAETLDQAINLLEQQLAEAEGDLAALTDTLNALLDDLNTKETSLRIDNACVESRRLHADRSPRKTEYHTSRSANEWKHFGRTRCMNL